jgi:choline dehydrogenase-like flavoprotein
MLRSPTAVDQGAELDFDLCIVGAGAAGITIAHRLRSAGLSIVLLEAGGMERPGIGPEHSFHGENVGREYSLIGTRLRYFGGTTNHWGGWSRPLDRLDFEARSHIPLSGWPFGHEEMAAPYREAARYCEIGPPGFELTEFPEPGRPADSFLSRHDPDFVDKNFRFSPPTRFGRVYRGELEASGDVHCFLFSTVTEIEVAQGRVVRLAVRGPEGKRFSVRAGAYVLAMGGIENARLLLHSDRAVPGGVGNGSGWVGRCFGDHLGKTIGSLLARWPLPYVRYEIDGVRVLPHLSLRDEALARHRLFNFGIMLIANNTRVTLPINYLADAEPGAATALPLESRGEPALGEPTPGEPAAAAPPPGQPPPGQLPPGQPPPGQPAGEWPLLYHVVVRFEPIPDPESRVTLIGERDRFGLRRVRLDWRLQGLEFECLDRLAELLGRRVGERNLGRFRRTYWNTDNGRAGRMTYQEHQLGTTRMSRRPGLGVVDADSRVHSVENLYVTGSSVYPSFGFANPTLTVVALAVRLADHLATVLKRS